MKSNRMNSWNTLKKVFFTLCFCMSTLSLFAQGGTVTGTVTDETGGPLPGANVIIKGTKTGVVTDANGKFSINAASTDVLQVSSVGYTTQDIEVGDQRSFEVSLSEGQQIEEVVVTALGVTREAKALGYSVSTIQSKEITKVGTSNFGTALYGKAAGVRVVSPPGGAASGVSFTIRGLSSLNGNTQPLIVFNGVPIRSGNNEGESMTGSFSSFRGNGIRSNGLVDINPEDIETLTILKGAAASAMYGSEGANGVVLITSKQAKQSGVTVDVNATFEANFVAYMPQIQSEYGPGLYSVSQGEVELAVGGFREVTYKGTNYQMPYYNTNVSFGPRYDGRPILYFDGSVRPYEAQTTNPWHELYETGFDQIYNIAVNHIGDKSSTRFSYTTLLEKPNGLTGNYGKHNFNLIGNVKLSERLSFDYSGNYIVQKFKNRVGAHTGAYDSFSNLFGSMTDISTMKQRYKSSVGYKTPDSWADRSLTPDENFAINPGPMRWVRDYLWGVYENENYENSNRLITSVAPKY
ncbi:MAG: TonB-dependent receptor plug domain-containing protein, partial [Bacteroidales bacterium]|nr:TonB-dependent receptor plug domain-containing protein [Bacteroidales bacterium]